MIWLPMNAQVAIALALTFGPAPAPKATAPAQRILVVCSTASCLPCRRQEATLDAYSWPVRIVKMKDAPEFAKMGVDRFPTLILAESDGTIIETRVGEQTRAQLSRWLYPPDPKKADAKTAPAIPAGWHSHTCPKCGTTWSHGPGARVVSHNCPKCGTYQNVVND